VAQLLELSLPQVRRRARPIDELRNLTDDLGASGVRQARQLLQVLRE